MLRFLVTRLLAAIPVVLIIMVIAFGLLHLTPGDPARVILGENATEESLQSVREALGLNAPLVVQFWRWVVNVLHGDFGTSMISQVPVGTLIAQRIGPTVCLALYSIVITIIVAIPLGVLAAWQRGAVIDRAILTLSVLGFSVPVFVLGYVLIGAFAIDVKWFAAQGYKSPADGIGPFLSHMTLPAVTLASTYIALIARMTRASMVEVLDEDFIRTARAKGLGEPRVLFRHALRNAAVPIITVVGSGFAMMISGVVITESVFNIPGIGRLVVESVLSRDYSMIQALILLTGVLYVVVNLLIDLAYAITDPRIRYQ
ncbi:ABC transporter permease [Martelella sp. HB161492]|uniref:ABC transporter permease n=1 Tax=Martelella sp. HB161492 TaxID=2720726 RepID=UPI0015907CEB|nr:ABC transporter permease [Martelella sp. HB161492]